MLIGWRPPRWAYVLVFPFVVVDYIRDVLDRRPSLADTAARLARKRGGWIVLLVLLGVGCFEDPGGSSTGPGSSSTTDAGTDDPATDAGTSSDATSSTTGAATSSTGTSTSSDATSSTTGAATSSTSTSTSSDATTGDASSSDASTGSCDAPGTPCIELQAGCCLGGCGDGKVCTMAGVQVCCAS